MPRIAPKYLPTQREIAAACETLRSGWTPEEFRRRRHTVTDASTRRSTKESAWIPPIIRLEDYLPRTSGTDES